MNDKSDMARRKKVFKKQKTSLREFNKSKQALQIELHATIEVKELQNCMHFFLFIKAGYKENQVPDI